MRGGRNRPSPSCKSCEAKYTKRYVDKKKQENPNYFKDNYKKHRKNLLDKQNKYYLEFRDWSNSLKLGPCSDCGNTFDPVCMQWDHLPEHKKSQSVSSIRGYTNKSKEKILKEIAKCELVCSNCHFLRTKNRNKYWGHNSGNN